MTQPNILCIMAGDGAATLSLRTPQGWTRCRTEAV